MADPIAERGGSFVLPAPTAILSLSRRGTIDKNPHLGNLSLLPPEIRSNIYSRLLDDDYRQVYAFQSDGSLAFDAFKSSPTPPFLCITKALRNDMLGTLSADRYCKVRIDEHQITTNLEMHDIDPNKTTASARKLTVPICKRIMITLDPPSPRGELPFYTLRQNIHDFVNIVNVGARDINPHICIEIDRTGSQYTYSYNDFAMSFGPFVGLSSRCRAVMAFRKTGIPCFHSRVERYCILIEAAMSFNPDAQRELLLHQHQIDIKLPVVLMPFNRLNHNILDNLNRPCTWDGPTQLSPRHIASVTSAATNMLGLYIENEEEMPAWLITLAAHLSQKGNAARISKELRAQVLQGRSALEVDLWAAGSLSRTNPIFDDVKFFSQKA